MSIDTVAAEILHAFDHDNISVAVVYGQKSYERDFLPLCFIHLYRKDINYYSLEFESLIEDHKEFISAIDADYIFLDDIHRLIGNEKLQEILYLYVKYYLQHDKKVILLSQKKLDALPVLEQHLKTLPYIEKELHIVEI